MRFDPDGRRFVAVAVVPSVLAAALRRRVLAVVLLALPAAVAAFFRDPERAVDTGVAVGADDVVAPADGVVKHAGPPLEGTAPPGEWQQISTFLALTDVHINRAPFGGLVTAVTHRPGRYLAAYRVEAAHQNERSEITVVRPGPDGDRVVVFRQIVGVLARRVVTRVRPGAVVGTGDRIGLMRFGSRMDVFVPPEVEVLVATGDRIRAGETVIGRWPAR